MRTSDRTFSEDARAAVADPQLRRAMHHVKSGFIGKRAKAVARLPEFAALRDAARDIKDHTLAHIDLYLERYEAQVHAAGGHVHWCATPAAARDTILDICRRAGARTVTKGKSMIGEEIDINAHLEAAGIVPVETDLGEYIIQLRHERPSHIIAPAVHLTKDLIEADFRTHHKDLAADRSLDTVPEMVDEARQVLRQRFLDADVGITGANFLIAETGSSIIVTNEGNGDLTQVLPRVHIVIASLEKIVPTLEDVSTILRVLARSATGQEFSTYTTVSTGPRRPGDVDGPETYHVILLDNGRVDLLGGPFQDILRCIRCGACMNHCPVYHAIGGHAYGSVYPGPIGAVLTPALSGIEAAAELPEASTLCGRCESVCPMRIPLPMLLRQWRERAFARRITPPAVRAGIGVWAFFARRPALYGLATGVTARLLAAMGRRRGRFARLPLAGGWTRFRDLPAPEGRTFRAQWAARQGDRR